MTVNERIYKLRECMKKNSVDIYIIPSDDFHQSETVGDYFGARAYMSGFSGSAGTLIVTKEKSYLWADGRYFIQAEKELAGSEIHLFKERTAGTPTILEFLEKEIKENFTLGFDGRVVSYVDFINYEKICKKVGAKILDIDYINDVWEDRPKMSDEKVFILDEKYSGESVESKLKRLREKMKEYNTDIHVISALDDICWLFNIRGRDIPCTPVVLSYAIISMGSATLFIDKNKLDETVTKFLENNKIEIEGYFDFYDALKEISKDSNVLLDYVRINSTIYKNLPKETLKINKENPTVLFKAIKNDIQLEKIKDIHIKDGVCFTKFMYWLKNNYDKMEITEMSASDYVDNLRRNVPGFIDFSFPTISAYGSNAAMMHYTASEKSNAVLKAGKMLLVDSGAHYFDGTTDITRTIALGELREEEKIHFTAVLRSMMALANTKYLYGVRGCNLDAIARAPIWELGIDYRCGTGHGVGHALKVHEDPNDFRLTNNFLIEKNMITTDEPGIYVEGSHGIRIENEILSIELEKNEYGQFMGFEPLTVAPIDLDAIDEKELTFREKEHLNKYHQNVYKKLSPYLNEKEKEWLKIYTREI